MPKIFLLINTLSHGGTEQIISTLSNFLSKDFDIQVFTLSNGGKIFYDVNKPAIPLYNGAADAAKIKKLITAFLRYVRIVRREKPDIVLSSHPETNCLNLLTYKLLGVKSIISIHEYPYKQFPVRRIVAKLSRFLGNRVVVVSEGLKELLCSEFSVSPKKITVIHNPVEVDRFLSQQSVPSSLHFEHNSHDAFFKTDKPVLINIGNLSHVKGQWHLIRVFRELQKTVPSRLVICGNGDTLPYLQQMAETYQLLNDILFTGTIDDVEPYLKSSDVFVLSSLSEGFGIVLVEALACGCPIVASDCPYGPREILENGKYGMLCSPQTEEYPNFESPLTASEQDMLDKIITLLMAPDLQNELSINGIERAKDFKPETACKKYVSVILSILSEDK